MKHISGILLVLFCSSFTATLNYPVAKLYAYQQKISRGANLTVTKKSVAEYTQYIYLLVKQNRSIQVETVWLNGKSVSFKTEKVQSPVKVSSGISFSGKVSEILVPETTHTVLQVFIDKKNEENASNIPERYKAYPLLIKYSEDKTTFYLGAGSWKTIAEKVSK